MILGAHRASSALCSLEPGTHLCALDADRSLLDRVAATFVGQGLAAGDQLLYVATQQQIDTLMSMLPTRVNGWHARGTGQLMVSSFEEAYGSSKPEDLTTVAEGFRSAAAHSRERGFPGLRVAARMDELAGLLGSFDEVVEWERMCTGLQQEIEVSSVCLYDASILQEPHGAAIADVHAGHAPGSQVSPLATFIATDEPWGLAVSGEVDLSNRDLLQRAVLSRVSVDPRVHLDLTDLSFADVGTLTRLRSIAASLPEDGYLVLAHPPAVVRRVMEATGLGHERLRILQ